MATMAAPALRTEHDVALRRRQASPWIAELLRNPGEAVILTSSRTKFAVSDLRDGPVFDDASAG